MLADAALVGFSAFAVAWFLSFWYRMDWIRERLGVYFVYDEAGEPMGRDDGGGLGGCLNCPQCTALIGGFVAGLLWLFFQPALVPLAGLGGALLIVRWYEAARPKARWWL